MISHCCEQIFQTKSRRAFACFCCKEFLRNIDKTVLEWMKMEKPIMDKETVEWIDKENANMTIVSDREVKNTKGEIVGKKVEKFEVKTTRTEMLEGIEVIKERLEKAGKQLFQFNKELLRMGKAPDKTPEIIRLEKNLVDLQKINQIVQLKAKTEPVEFQMKMDSEQIKTRQGFIDQAPKD